jgi:uncharacterized protein
MHLRIHEDPASFLADAGPFLRAAEAANSSVMAQMTRMIAAPGPDDANPYLACAVDRGVVVAATVLTSSETVQVTGGPVAAFDLVAADIRARTMRARRIVGPRESCEAFAHRWRELTGCAHELRFHLRHFALTATPSLPRVPGTMRCPEPMEHALIADWICAFMIEAQLPPEEPERIRARFLQRMERGLIRVWDDRGVVSLAGYGEIPGDGGPGAARIGPVYTPPERRGRGYASALVATLSRELLGGGRRTIYLTADLANPISNGIYEKIGYRRDADHFHFDFLAGPAAAA